MALSEAERTNYINFLRDNTEYSRPYLNGLHSDQLYNMYHRISLAIPQYISDILEKTKEPGYVGRKYTRLELTKMNYNELALIRKSLGIRKGKKKVTKVEEAPKKTLQQAGEIYHQMTIEELCNKIIINEETEKEFEHEEFLDSKELNTAYDGEIPSPEELKKKGIVNLDAENERFKDVIRQRIELKKAIMQIVRKVSRSTPLLLKLSTKEIEALDFDELIAEYRRLQSKIPTIPKIEEVQADQIKKLGLK